jgi:hypothetical protein
MLLKVAKSVIVACAWLYQRGLYSVAHGKGSAQPEALTAESLLPSLRGNNNTFTRQQCAYTRLHFSH